jgi:GNAT superfamily N-acetyltransferase
MKEANLRLLKEEKLEEILLLTSNLNPETDIATLRKRQIEMFEFENYRCFGFYENERLLGVSSGWMTVRLYSGKQLEVDNVIIKPDIQSKGIGSKFIKLIEHWAKENDCLSVELNTYTQNSRSHKFYFNQGYQILGFHFQKKI